MNSIAPVFRKAYEFFWQYPALWLPVLIADAGRFVIAETMAPLRQAVIRQLMPRSVLGGYAGDSIHLPMAPVIVGGIMQWFIYVVGIYLYLYAIGVLARGVSLVERGATPRSTLTAEQPARIWRSLGSIVVKLVVAGLAATIIVASLAGKSLPLAFAAAAIVGIVFLYAVTLTLRRFVAANRSATGVPPADRTVDFMLFFTAVTISSAWGYAFRYISQHDEGLARLSFHTVPWEALLLVLSLVGALPYVFATIGFALVDVQTESSALRDELPE